MLFNTSLTVEPYQGLTSAATAGESQPSPQGDSETGVAWLSSARVVRCWVKSRNERNPHPMLPAREGGNSWETAGVTRRKVRMTSSQHGPYTLGYKHATMDGTQSDATESVTWSQSQKSVLSSDCRLQLACMKLESLVTAGQRNCGEYVPGPCTHRPSRHLSCLHPKSVG